MCSVQQRPTPCGHGFKKLCVKSIDYQHTIMIEPDAIINKLWHRVCKI